MIVQKDFLNKLKDFGLNSYESKLWTALLSRGVSTAGELSDIANVPRSRSYDVLESLEKKGFIIMKRGKPIKYMAVSPQEVIERVKKRLQEDVGMQVTMLDSLHQTEILNDLNMLHKQGIEMVEPSDISGSFRGRESVYNHMETLIKGAKKSIMIVTTADGLARKTLALKRALGKAKQNGVSIKIAAPLAKDKPAAAELGKLAEIRHTDHQGRFTIIDQNEVVIALTDDKDVHQSYDTAVWFRSPYFASLLTHFFNRIWKDEIKK